MEQELKQEHIREMLEHARQEYPSECVGAVTGKPDEPDTHTLIRLTNRQDDMHKKDAGHYSRSSRTAYFVDPKEVYDLFTNAEKEGKKLLALYHSHPDHDCYFSQEDHDAAVMWGEPVFPGTAYVVISVREGEVGEAGVFTFTGETYEKTDNLPVEL